MTSIRELSRIILRKDVPYKTCEKCSVRLLLQNNNPQNRTLLKYVPFSIYKHNVLFTVFWYVFFFKRRIYGQVIAPTRLKY